MVTTRPYAWPLESLYDQYVHREYARIATYLESNGYGYRERKRILENLIRNGEYYKFGG